MDQSVAVIVQARWGSSRLPGKVLRELKGRTVLRRVLERCLSIKQSTCVCCAIPDGMENEPVVDEALRSGVTVTRGSETDVLDRYYEAAKILDATVIMRVTSDCPLLDPQIADGVLKLVLEGGADYACNNLPASWPHGLDCEAFRFGWLERAAGEARLPSQREHVTPFIRSHPKARKLVLPCPVPNLSAHRWTLDTDRDLVFLRAIFERLPEGRKSYSYTCPLRIVENEPDLMIINGGQDRDAGLKKSLAADALHRTGHGEP